MSLLLAAGSYDETGTRGGRLLEALGLQGTDYVTHIGAWSGRLSYALKDDVGMSWRTTVVEAVFQKNGREKLSQ
jgi:hypothetical protein